MQATLEKDEDLTELSRFLSKINTHKKSQIGCCCEKPEEIFKTLKEASIEDDGDANFFIARNNMREIVAAIGLDIDEATAEVWGPFYQTSSAKLQFELWKQLLNANTTVQSCDFFLNKEYTQQHMTMYDIKSEK